MAMPGSSTLAPGCQAHISGPTIALHSHGAEVRAASLCQWLGAGWLLGRCLGAPHRPLPPAPGRQEERAGFRPTANPGASYSEPGQSI